MSAIAWRAVIVALLCWTISAPAHCQSADADAAAQARREESRAAYTAAMQAATAGPAKVPLRDQGTLDLPAGMSFIPEEQGARLMRANGNRPGPSFAGLVMGGPAADWFVVMNLIKDGYVRDDDARDWNADDLLTALREGNDESNKDRAARGFPQIELRGWVQKPSYDAATHRLVWSMATKAQGEDDQGVNYNTYALGRDGHLSLNLITDLSRIDANRSVATDLLARFQYLPGKRYDDFNATTDRVAEYGLAALIGVAAAKKLGLLAVIAAFALKFAKVGLLGVVGVGALIAKFWRRKPPAGGTPAA